MSPEQPGLTVADAPPDPEAPRASVPPTVRPGDNGSPRQVKPPRSPRQRLVARRVHRIVRRLDPWSVLKVSVVFYLCCYVVAMVAGVLLWNLAASAEVIDKTESFVEDMGAYQSFEFLPDRILGASLLIGAILAILATGLTVLAAVLFNLISDLVGGIRVVVIEEESARPAPGRGDTVTGSSPRLSTASDDPGLP